MLSDDAVPAPRERWPGAVELWHRYHATGPGDASEEELVKQYLPLVKSVVARLAITLPPLIDLEELQSAGMIGLLNAVRNFDPHTGSPFEAYARLRIRGAVIDELRRMDWVPRSVHVKARKIRQAMEVLEQRQGRFATDDEVAAELGVPVEEYRQWLDDVRPATFVCLDAAHQEQDEEEGTHHEVVSDPTQEDAMEVAARAERARLIAERLQQLPDLHRKVIALYYYEGLRLREIAAAAGLCESRICQVHAQAILAIKSYLEACEALPAKR
jgi:RNA polymerase sigma factor for flagellar operon FliA